MRQLASHVLDDRALGINHVRYSPAGDWIVGGGGFINEPGRIAIWDADSHQRRAVCPARSPQVTAMAISPDRRILLSACEGTDSLEIWETASWQRAGCLPVIEPPFRRNAAGLLAKTTRIDDLVFSDDARFLAAGCRDTTAKVWDMESQARKEFATPDRSGVDLVAFLGGGRLLAFGTRQTVCLWDHATGALERKIPLDRDETWRHLAMPARQQIVSVSHRGRIRLHDVAGGDAGGSRIGFKRDPCAWAYSESSDLLAIGFPSGMVVFWSVEDRAEAGRWKVGADDILSMSFHPTRASVCIVTSSPEDRVVAFDYEV